MPAARSRASPAADPFADLLGNNADAAPMSLAPAPAPPPINTADPFGDLLGTPSAAPPPAAQPPDARAFPQGTIPDDFDPIGVITLVLVVELLFASLQRLIGGRATRPL